MGFIYFSTLYTGMIRIEKHMMSVKTIMRSGLLVLLSLAMTDCAGFSSKNRDIDLVGHRGARGYRPENTIPSFQYGIENNMTAIELDVNVTRDKDLIIYHDTEITGALCLDESGKPAATVPIRDLTVEELKKYDCGALQHREFPQQITVEKTRLITLKEFFEFVKSYETERKLLHATRIKVEIKFPRDYTPEDIKEAANLVVKNIEEAGMTERAVVQSFVIAALPEVRKLNKNIQTSALFEPRYSRGAAATDVHGNPRNTIIKEALNAGADMIAPHYIFITPQFVRECHRKNLRVIAWTVNDKAQMEKLLSYGVDGIISDYPDILYLAYKEWKTKKKKYKL